MNHIFYGFKAGFSHRHRLAAILRSSGNSVSTALVEPLQLKASGTKVLALDFDGVLAPHGRVKPIPEAEKWLATCCACFSEECIYILSNKPTAERRAWFSSYFPGIRFISGVRKKPYPDGLLNVIELSGAKPDEIMLLDDRLLTGVLATCLACTGVTWINSPYMDIRGNPMQEIFFAAIRAIEQTVMRLVSDKETERSNR